MPIISILAFAASFLVGGGAVVALAWLLRGANREAGQRRVQLEAVVDRIGSLETELQQLRKTAETVPAPLAETPAIPVRLKAINFELRGQITRLARRGETAENIAAVLRMPLNQVTLALKAQRAYLDSSVSTGANAPLQR